MRWLFWCALGAVACDTGLEGRWEGTCVLDEPSIAGVSSWKFDFDIEGPDESMFTSNIVGWEAYRGVFTAGEGEALVEDLGIGTVVWCNGSECGNPDGIDFPQATRGYTDYMFSLPLPGYSTSEMYFLGTATSKAMTGDCTHVHEPISADEQPAFSIPGTFTVEKVSRKADPWSRQE